MLASVRLFGIDPALFVHLSGAGNSKGIVGYVFGYHRACGGVGVFPYGDRRHKGCMATQKGSVLNYATLFIFAVKVYGGTAAANINIFAKLRIPDI